MTEPSVYQYKRKEECPLSYNTVAHNMATHQLSTWCHRSAQETQETLSNLIKERAKYLSEQVFPLFDEIAEAIQARNSLVEQGKFSSDQAISIA